MSQWAAFVGLTGFLVTALLLLSRLSQRTLSDRGRGPTAATDGAGLGSRDRTYPRFETAEAVRQRRHLQRQLSTDELSTGALLANVALTQGLFGVLVVGGAFFFEIPPSALGITDATLSTGLPAVALGVAAGVGFWVGNELAAAAADGVGITVDESLRELLAPDSPGGWVVLVGVVLPTIAIVEELLFRAAAIGVPVAGLGAPAWAMVLLSSIAFALGHGAQGRVGIAVTGALGLALGALFVLTESLLAVVVAHYCINAFELVVHEGIGISRPRL